MTLQLDIPRTCGPPLSVPLDKDKNSIFVLGANGSGKSALLHALYQQHTADARLFVGHRQLWVSSDYPDLSQRQFRSAYDNMLAFDAQLQARYTDSYAANRPQITLNDLRRSRTRRAMRITSRLEEQGSSAADDLAQSEPDPLLALNDLFQIARLSVQIMEDEEDPEILKALHCSTGATYGIRELSDGERAALLLGADVLSAPSNRLFLIDEPERHLHRSIASPFLSELFARRPDCYFVLSTHDVSLPGDCAGSSHVLILRGATFSSGRPSAWEAGLHDMGSIPDEVREDICGSRPKLLYVEGRVGGSDERLYSAVFPNVTVRPVGGCEQVIEAVAAVRGVYGSPDIDPWIEPVGLIDGDNRTPDDVSRLRSEQVFALPVRAVESLYYCEAVWLAMRVHLKSSVELLSPDYEDAMRAVICESKLEMGGSDHDKGNLTRLVAQGDGGSVVRDCPIGKSNIPDQIAQSLGLRGRRDYERLACRLIRDDPQLRAGVASMCGDVVDLVAT